MNFSQLRREQVIAFAFLILALISVVGGDALSAVVWALLSVSSLLYQSPPGEPVRGFRDIEWTPRNAVAVGAALIALVIIVAQIMSDIAG